MTADSTTVEIVNTNQVEEQRLVVQGGAYGEHKIVSAATDGGGAQSGEHRPAKHRWWCGGHECACAVERAGARPYE